MYVMVLSQVLTDRAGYEENEDYSGSYPEGAVQIRIAVQYVEERGARIEGGGKTAKHLRSVYIEELGVEGKRPEKTF